MQKVDVAIVGGGPAGLLAAKAVARARPGALIQVYESVGSYRPQGAGVAVHPNGWRALQAIDPALELEMKSHAISLGTNATMYSHKGDAIPSPFAGQGPNLLLIQWNDIRGRLHDCLEPGVVRMGARVVDCSPGTPDSPARLRVAHGADGAEEDVSAELVLVADGFFSKTRQQVFGDAAAPVFRDKVVWRALLSYDDDAAMPGVLEELHAARSGIFWTEPSNVAGVMLPRRSAVAYPVGGRRFVWTCISPVEELAAKGMDVSALRTQGKLKTGLDKGVQQSGSGGDAAKARVALAFSDFPAPLRSLIERTSPSTISEHAYFTHDAERLAQGSWVQGRVALIGDAAHTLPPTGQGVNQAWEDCAVLGAALQTHGISAQALAAYEAVRLPRVKALLGGIGRMAGAEYASLLEGATFEPLTGAASMAAALAASS